jgi:hypothetical protein
MEVVPHATARNPGRACTPVVALSERQVNNSPFRFARHLAKLLVKNPK